jgi:peptidoglycan hydrolase-like protein with peptidoglycan-binding domain
LGADGDFGASTKNAVMNFQKSVGIGVDGIAGYQTLTAIDNAIKNLSSNSDDGKLVRITANVLNVRRGAGTDHSIVSTVRKNSIRTVVEEVDDWGRITDPPGWISRQYYEDV